MIKVFEHGKLYLAQTVGAKESPYISAASGLAWVGDNLYVVADDALHLGVFTAPFTAPGIPFRLLEGELPQEHKARKASKPDFEVLLHWADYPSAGGALIALGSGSKKTRNRGVFLPLDKSGRLQGTGKPFSLLPLYAAIENEIADLNIEGAVIQAQELWLFQRGNAKHAQNAIVRVPLNYFRQCVEAEAVEAPLTPAITLQYITLGSIEGVPLGFTDALLLPDNSILFSAAAEDTQDTYHDGRCAGSVVGAISAHGALLGCERIDLPCKVEGISARPGNGIIELLMVTDADNDALPAMLLKAEWRG